MTKSPYEPRPLPPCRREPIPRRRANSDPYDASGRSARPEKGWYGGQVDVEVVRAIVRLKRQGKI